MRNEKNIAILNEMVSKIRICVFTTINKKTDFDSRPMATAKVEEDGSIWFFTNEYSDKSEEIKDHTKVALGYSDPSSSSYIFINGLASMVDDKVRMKAYFNPLVKAWFPDGLEDPRLTLIKVEPVSAEFWESSSSRIILAFNVLKSIVKGEEYDDGKHDVIKF